MPPPIDTPSSNADELPEHVDDEHPVDPDTGKKITRPRNAWILFRNEMLDRVPRLPDGSRQPMADASKIISAWWKKATPEVKYRYELEAEKEKEEHKRKYPNYRFQPKSKMQKAKEKAAKREAAKKAQQQTKKTKTRAPTPPQVYASAHATSYLAAALANQASLSTASTSLMSTYGREGPSPPLSLASTPTTTPSPFPSSDFEQGSSTSTSATSAQAMPSPSDALGLGLPSPLSFDGQEEANARVPQRPPTRLPPRKKVSKIKTEIFSRVASSSNDATRALTPATGTSSALSPLPWPLPSGNAQHATPQSCEPSPSSALVPPCTPSPEQWSGASTFAHVPAAPDNLTGDLNLTMPDEYSDEFFGNLHFGLSALPENEGMFSMSMDAFAGHQLPDQFDVSLDPTMPTVTPELTQSFSDFLNTFDFRHQPDDSLQDVPPPSMDPISAPEPDPSSDMWQMWTNAEHTVGDAPSSSAMLTTDQEFQYDRMGLEPPAQEPTPPAEYLHPIPEANEDAMQVQDAPQHQAEGASHLAIPSHYPAHLASDPDFVEVYQQYVAKVQQRRVQAGPHVEQQYHHAPYTPQEQQQQLPHDEVQYHPHAYAHESRNPSYSGPISPPSSVAEDVHSTACYVPPSGAATTIGIRRVGGTWRPPAGPPPSEEAGSRVPSWGSVVSI
ncbi:hypothetical protein PsYK624_136010 [Phanerochaete sordida]|uniref:HMG box domain-containing protein n=1 Tax=Phanerochaete sordida TaxID=48140 RepID=A0A9P3GQ15_9APHY|nr:hypothetical protein PsYK624_136010 [Phanerochaete sordida]